MLYFFPFRNPAYTYKKGSSLPSSIKYVFQRNLKCIFSVPFPCYWTGSPFSNLPQGCLTEMTNYTSYEVLYFLLHFIFPYGLHPFPAYFYHIDLYFPHPRFRQALGTPSPSRSFKPHNEMASSQLVRTYFVSSTLRYYTIRRTYSLGWQSRQMRSSSVSGTARQDREEQWPARHLGAAGAPTMLRKTRTCIGHDGTRECGRER